MMRRPPVRGPIERRLSAYSKPEGECLVWVGPLRNGYGRTWVDGRCVPAHRAAYEAWVGPIPEGLQLDHLCRNTRCIRPEHLEPVTNRENTMRGIGPTAAQASSPSCKRGHPLEGDNLATGTFRGWPFRRCRTCWRAAQREAAKRQRERRWAAGLTSHGDIRQRTTDKGVKGVLG